MSALPAESLQRDAAARRASAGGQAPLRPSSPANFAVHTHRKERHLSVDAARGLAMVLMALDHSASFARVNVAAESYSDRPTHFAGPGYVVTGLLTNLSAPMFWLLAGLSIALLANRDRRDSGSVQPTIRYLLVRSGVLGWFPLLVGGLAVGRAFAGGAFRRARDWALFGMALLAICLLLRLTGYGAVSAWHPGDGGRSALIMRKGSPGLDYLSFNLGWGMLATAALIRFTGARFESRPGAWLVTLGRASLFFYFAHLVVYHVLGLATFALTPLRGAVAYAACFLVGLALLIPATGAYRKFKEAHPRSLLRYI